MDRAKATHDLGNLAVAADHLRGRFLDLATLEGTEEVQRRLALSLARHLSSVVQELSACRALAQALLREEGMACPR